MFMFSLWGNISEVGNDVLGHASFKTTLRYIHLSGRDLAAKLEQSMSSIHAKRIIILAEALI